ncbi:MAG: polymer-forming cytoskeletal protein [Spirochaetales bacterium]|nr:polymer-forming cytoskeletal protein [Spirochaetales bacterium]
MSDIQVYNLDESEIDTVLADDIDFNGILEFKDSLLIKGSFKGNIKASGELYIDENANVEARIHSDIVSLKGHVTGDIFAETRVELFASASVDGDITAPDIIMESGCRFNGSCTMKSPSEVIGEDE